jgi:hypothetical protein
MWLKQQSPLVLISCNLCSSTFQIQNGLFCSISNRLDCCTTSEETLFFRSLNVNTNYRYKALSLRADSGVRTGNYNYDSQWLCCSIFLRQRKRICQNSRSFFSFDIFLSMLFYIPNPKGLTITA